MPTGIEVERNSFALLMDPNLDEVINAPNGITKGEVMASLLQG